MLERKRSWQRVVVALAMAGLLGLTACSTTELSDAEYVARAKDYQDEGKYRESLIELKNALRQNPDNSEARWILGNTHLAFGDGASAEKELRRAQELGVAREALSVPLARALLLRGKFSDVVNEPEPLGSMAPADRAALFALRGEAYLGLQDLGQAERALRRGSEIQPDAVEVLIGWARWSATEQRLGEARGYLEKALAAVPAEGRAWSLLGDVERWDGNLAAADQAYGKAIEYRLDNDSDRLKRVQVRIAADDIDGAEADLQKLKHVKDHQDVSYAAGLLELKRQQYAKAQNLFETTLKQAPNFPPALFYLGVAHFAQEHQQQAVQYLQRYLTASPQSREAGTLLAMAYLRQNDYRRAEEILLPLRKTAGDDPLVLNLLAKAALVRGDMARGTEYLRRVAQLEPQSGLVRLRLSLGLMMQGESKGSMKELESAIELDPQLLQADVLLILNYLNTRQFDKALEAAQHLLAKQPDSALTHNLLGLIHLRQGDMDKAQPSFMRALELSPGNPTANHNLAVIALSRNDIKGAMKYYEAALKENPDNSELSVRLAALQLRAGNREQVEQRLREAVEHSPKALEPRMFLADYYISSGAPSKALPLLQEIKGEHGGNQLFMLTLGRAQFATGQFDQAAYTLQALASSARSVEAHALLAQIHAERDDVAKVRQELDAALRIDPDHYPTKVVLVRLLITEGRLAEARKAIGELSKAHPDAPMVLDLAGLLAVKEKRLDDAIRAYQKAAEILPTTRAVVSLAGVYWLAGDTKRSVAVQEDWVAANSGDTIVRLSLANTYLSLDQPDAAIKVYERIVELQPNHAIALNQLAWMMRESDRARARDYAERAAKAAPNMPEVLDTLGMILLADGDSSRAVSVLEEALSKADSNLSIRYHLASALAKAGNKARAKRELEKIFEAKRDFPEHQAAQALHAEL